MEINILNDKCIVCERCVKVCPSAIFRHIEGNGIATEHKENCIVCGHCVAVCPTSAVVHSEFPPAKIHSIDRETLPSAEQVMLLLRSRRSNRAFSKEPVPQELIGQILEAAHRAPTASNMQKVEFTVVTDPELLHRISEITIDTFYGMFKKAGNPIVKPLVKKFMPEVYRMLPRFEMMKARFEAGKDLILRGATGVIFIHTPKEVRFGAQDCNLAYQNGSIMAESLRVSQFYTGFVCTAVKQDSGKRINKLFDIEGTIHAGMAVGMPEFKYPNYIDKKDLMATYF